MRKILLVGALVLVLLALIAGILSIFWNSLAPLLRGGVNLGLGPLSAYVTATADEGKKMAVSGPVDMTVDVDHGQITITSSEDTSLVVVSAHKTAYAATQKQANDRLEALKVNITQSGNTIEIRYRSPNPINLNQGSPDSVDLDIIVPQHISLNVHTGSGDISTKGTQGDATLVSDYGDIKVNNLQGGLKADTSSGTVMVAGLVAGGSDIGLHSDYGSLTLKDSSGASIQLSSSSGNLELDHVDGAGKVQLDSSYGAVSYATGSAASVHIQASSGKLTVTDVVIQGELFAHSEYGDIQMERSRAASYDLDTSSGAVNVDGVSGALKAHSGYGSIKVTRGNQVNLDLNTNSGDIDFSGSLGGGPHSLVTSYGSIQLALPAVTSINIDLKTDYGKVKSALPVTLTGDLQSDHWVGKINAGGSSLTAQTTSGDIRIEILNPQ